MTTTGIDSANRPIKTGDRVSFRGQEYIILGFHPGEGRFGSSRIEFIEEEVHTAEVPDEVAVDLVEAL